MTENQIILADLLQEIEQLMLLVAVEEQASTTNS